MSFDALLTIVFILFFVVGPLIRRISGGQQKPGPGQSGPARKTTPERRPQQTTTEGPLARRLEEARRRVQEAMDEAQAAPPTHPESSRELDWQEDPRASTPRELDWQDSPQRAEPRKLDWQQAATTVEPFIKQPERPRRTRQSKLREAVAEVRTERRKGGKRTARLRSKRRPALDDDGMINGMIWHEILSEPVAKRGTRRQTSRLRSR